jgi:lipocalin
MRILITTALSSFLLVSAAPFGDRAQAIDLRAQPAADLMRLAGGWYELARTPNRLADVIHKQNGRDYSACFNVRVNYTVEGAGKLRITSSCTRQSAQGDVIQDVIDGVALVLDGARNLKFKVAVGGSAAFRGLQRLLTGGGKLYSIYCLGPVNGDGHYDWLVGGDPDRRHVFLLARDRTVTRETESGMLSCARRQGVPVNRLMYLQR